MTSQRLWSKFHISLKNSARNVDNVFDPRKVAFLYNEAPYMEDLATQNFLNETGIHFWGNDSGPEIPQIFIPPNILDQLLKMRLRQEF
jgi:hypothetical protein